MKNISLTILTMISMIGCSSFQGKKSSQQKPEQPTPINPRELAYYEACSNPETQPSAQATVEFLKDLMKESDCELGAEKLLKLKSLNLRNQESKATQVTDLKPIQDLNLERLTISDLNIQSFEPIGTLKKLTSLNIFDTNLDRLEFLRGLKNLRSLALGNANFRPFMPPETFSLADFSAIEDLKLTSFTLFTSDVNNLDFLKNQDQLRSLDIPHCRNLSFDSLGILPNPAKLANLTLNDTRPNPDPKEFKGFENLATLEMKDLGTSNIGFLADSKNIVYLNLDGNPIDNLAPLKNLKGLSSLSGVGLRVDLNNPETCPNGDDAPKGLREYCIEKRSSINE